MARVMFIEGDETEEVTLTKFSVKACKRFLDHNGDLTFEVRRYAKFTRVLAIDSEDGESFIFVGRTKHFVG